MNDVGRRLGHHVFVRNQRSGALYGHIGRHGRPHACAPPATIRRSKVSLMAILSMSLGRSRYGQKTIWVASCGFMAFSWKFKSVLAFFTFSCVCSLYAHCMATQSVWGVVGIG